MRIIENVEMNDNRDFYVDGNQLILDDYTHCEDDDPVQACQVTEEFVRAEIASEGKLEFVILDLGDTMIHALLRK